MQDFDSVAMADQREEWCLWLGTRGWAWARCGQAWTEQPWPDGEPPLELPFELLGATLGSAVGSPSATPLSVRLMCADWVDGTATDWWPGRRRAVRLWRHWLASQGLILVAVMRAVGAHADGQMGIPQAQWMTLWRLGNQFHRFFPVTAGWRCLWSILGALGLHVALAQVIRPAWEHQLLQYQRQAEQTESERLEQEGRQRLQALQEEKSRQRQQWEQEQVRGLAPWRELARFMASRPESDAPELWTGLRWAEGTWTVSGVVSHEPESGQWQPVAGGSIRIANLNATATTWPLEPAWGWPAWRFQWQLESEAASAKTDGS